MIRYAEYDTIAWIYNRYWGPHSAQRFFPVVEKLVLSLLPPHAYILDLCCGTGQLAESLAQRSYRVTGVDGSEGMIRHARTNAPDVEFLAEDARTFCQPDRYHAVISTYDSLNHLMDLEEFSQVMRNVFTSLKGGGIFLFDLNMAEGYQSRWRGSFGVVEDDHAFIVRSSFDENERVGRTAITVFRLKGKTWRRSDIVLLQRCFSQEEIQSALEKVGFTDIQVYDAQKDLGWSREVGRAFFLSRKPR